MYRRVLPFLTIAVILACNAENSTQPPPALPSSASPVISDGARPGGNPDFFFLPGAVPDPKNHADFGDDFNGSLLPVVNICELDPPPGGDDDVNPNTACKSGGYDQNFQLTAANVNLAKEHYQLDWVVPVAAAVYYRITVMVGSITLGFADLKTAATSKDLKGTDPDNFITRTDGSDFPIKFRIEEFALCEVPGTGPCSSETVDTDEGGTVSTTFTGDTEPTGIEFQENTGVGVRTVTIEECPVGEHLSDRIDLPTFGRCARVTLDPPLGPGETFDVPAIAFICSAPGDVAAALNATQAQRVTMHRFDEPDQVTALPYVKPDACGPPPSIGAVPTLKGMLAALVRGRFKSAGSQLVGMFSPKPLYATLMLDEGGGGETESASDFQFALPAKMEKVASTDNQTAPPGTLATSPKVIVTDLAGDPVANARVRFAGTTEAACLATLPATGVLTAADGSASKSWTIVAGPNTLVACGRGIADADEATNGPRTGPGAFDPFQPIQAHFDGGSDPDPLVPEPVLVGSVSFSATGGSPEVIVLNDINLFDNTGLGNAENGDFLTGVLNYTNTGPRASQTVVMFDVGRSTSLCTTGPSTPYCPAASGPGDTQFTTLRGAITGMGLTISDVASSSLASNTVLRTIPANVKAIFLWMPIESFAYDEINALKTFVGEGGLVVYIGENDAAYGPSASGGWQNGDPAQDFFLTDMGSAMTRTGGAFDGTYITLPPASLTLAPSSSAKHPIMTNVTSLTVAAVAQVTLGAADATLFRNSGNSVVLGAVANINLTPMSPPFIARVMSRTAIAQRAASVNALSAASSNIDATTGAPPR